MDYIIKYRETVTFSNIALNLSLRVDYFCSNLFYVSIKLEEQFL